MCIPFHLIDGGQFDPVAFELNRYPHLLAGISPAHVAPAATEPACGVGGANLIDDRSGLVGDTQSLVQRQQIVPAQHCCLLLVRREGANQGLRRAVFKAFT